MLNITTQESRGESAVESEGTSPSEELVHLSTRDMQGFAEHFVQWMQVCVSVVYFDTITIALVT